MSRQGSEEVMRQGGDGGFDGGIRNNPGIVVFFMVAYVVGLIYGKMIWLILWVMVIDYSEAVERRDP